MQRSLKGKYKYNFFFGSFKNVKIQNLSKIFAEITTYLNVYS